MPQKDLITYHILKDAIPIFQLHVHFCADCVMSRSLTLSVVRVTWKACIYLPQISHPSISHKYHWLPMPTASIPAFSCVFFPAKQFFQQNTWIHASTFHLFPIPNRKMYLCGPAMIIKYNASDAFIDRVPEIRSNENTNWWAWYNLIKMTNEFTAKVKLRNTNFPH